MRRTRPIPGALEKARQRFENWRANRESPRSRIPDTLWETAVKLAGEHGNYLTAQTLRLNADSLKKHAGSIPVSRKKKTPSSAAFVEVLPIDRSVGSEYIVELEDANGARMKIHVKGEACPDLTSLTTSFWKGEA